MAYARTPTQARAVSTTRLSQIAGFLGFGTDNLFPQKLVEVIGDSPTAKACLGTKARFIEGNGFQDVQLSNMTVHRSGLKMDEVLRRTARNLSVFEVIALHISYNGLGEISGFKPVPAQLVRLALPDGLDTIVLGAICPYLGSPNVNRNRKFQHTVLPLFNPNTDIVLSQIELAGGISNYTGQLLYEPIWNEADEYYHVPDYFSAIKDIETDAQLSMYDFRTVTNGFNTSGIFAYLGKGGVNDESDTIEQALAQHQGADNAASVMTVKAESLDELNAMKFLDTTGAQLSDRYNSTNTRVQERITRAMGVPNELVNIRRNGGIAPTGDEIRVASQLLQSAVNPLQRKISETFTRIFQHWKEPVTPNFTIENLNYFPDNGTAIIAG